MEREKAFSYTASCIAGQPPSCVYACPFHLDLRSFLKKAAKGRWDAAYKELRTSVLFPEVVAALCTRPCEGVCQRRTVLGDDPLAMGLMERACIANAGRKEAISYAIPPKEEKVAVVGAGPAGLSAALLLGQKKVSVSVFEKAGGWGGSLRAHPDFAAFEEEFASAFAAVEVDFHYGAEVRALAELAAYDAVLLATGRGGETFGLLPGWDETLFSTNDPRVYLCGEMTGVSLVEGMAQAIGAVRSIEAYLQAGSTSFAAAQQQWDAAHCTRFVPHPGKVSEPGVRPAGEAYAPEEAQAEAARCMQCDCDACMQACELLVNYKKKPPRLGNDVFMDSQGRNSVSSANITRQTWSCNLCGRCGNKCHLGVDVRGLFQLSRADRVQSGYYPPALHDYWLREMAFHAGVGSIAATKDGADSCTYAFFSGCALGDVNPAHVQQAYAVLREKIDAGLLLNCCGAPAWWAGEDAVFEAHLAALQALWEGLGRPTLVVACATCLRMLGTFLPEIPLVSLYEVLAEHAPAGGASPLFAHAALFDPCAAWGQDGMRASVRKLCADGGVTLSDYDSDGQCCGFGGHMQLADPALYDEITHARIAETDAPFIVYCANCRNVFSAADKPCAHVLDVVFGLLDENAPGDAPAATVPTLDEKRRNSLQLKKELMRMYWGEDFSPEAAPWEALRVCLAPGVAEKMEKRLVTLEDVRETIWRAREAGEGFCNADGEILCSLPGQNVTYWVLYSMQREPDGGECAHVADVYSHRMRPREQADV